MAPTPGRFDGRRAIVTGASSGIGRATAIRLAREGARVALIARGRAGLDAVAAEIGDPQRALVLTADCTDEAEVRTAIDTAAAAFGGLDTIVSNAGIARRLVQWRFRNRIFNVRMVVHQHQRVIPDCHYIIVKRPRIDRFGILSQEHHATRIELMIPRGLAEQ